MTAKRLISSDSINTTEISVGRMLDFVNWRFQDKVVIYVHDENSNLRGVINIYNTKNGVVWDSKDIRFFEDWTLEDVFNLRAFEIGFDDFEKFLFIAADVAPAFEPIQ